MISVVSDVGLDSGNGIFVTKFVEMLSESEAFSLVFDVLDFGK